MNANGFPHFICANTRNIIFNKQETSATQNSKTMWDLRACEFLGKINESTLGVFELNRIIHRSNQAVQTR